jgi:hypothetical protein
MPTAIQQLGLKVVLKLLLRINAWHTYALKCIYCTLLRKLGEHKLLFFPGKGKNIGLAIAPL